ncbi:hypothetical protein SAMN03159496_05589 [Rhizobium sp. NFR07]|uniref:hypothetical protein n=1 Tax=Rhizobium sp. NFR07 TaxID=1566262 RepID=UPI0008EE3BED|nr:hypothetical protein [Rhizobium sp. NFR07]SFB59704.1 hypothetical protein SAMN03159496_05589 [Rhizobium sp. NFR07]
MLHDKAQDVTTAIIGRLRDIGAAPGKAVVMYEIGVPLVAAGYNQHEIANALFRLEKDGVIELMMSNALKLLQPL